MTISKPIDELELGDIEALVDLQLPEGAQLEFKRDHYGSKDEDKREFAADVSAFVNARGGYLLIGVDEDDQGRASGICPLDVPNPDKLLMAIRSSLRTSCEPELTECRVRFLPTSEAKGVLVVHAPRSWQGPHRVTAKKDHHFYTRDENGKRPMSVAEIRRVILQSGSISTRVREFVDERIKLILGGQGSFPVDVKRPLFVLHIAPQISFYEAIHIDRRIREKLSPIGSGSFGRAYSIDGLISYSNYDQERGVSRAHTTSFSDGKIEFVAGLYMGDFEGRRTIEHSKILTYSEEAMRDARDFYKACGLAGPFLLSIAATSVGDTYPVENSMDERVLPVRRPNLLFPIFSITEEEMGHDSQFGSSLAAIIDMGFGKKPARDAPSDLSTYLA